MATVNLATLEAVLKLRDEFSPALNSVSAGLGSLRGKLEGVLQGFTFAAGVKAAVEFGKAIGDLAKRAEELGNLSKKTGLAVESIQQLQRVAANAGGSFDQISTAVKFMQKNLVDGKDAFAALGLKVSDLMRLKPEEQLQKTAAAIASIKDPAERTAAALDVFGRSGADLLPMIDQLAQGSSDLALSLSGEQVAALSALDDQIDLAEGGLADLRDQFLAAIAASPAVVNAIGLIAQAIRGIAEAVRDAAPAIQAFVSTTLGMLANAGAKLAAFADEIQRGHGLSAALDAAAGATFNLQTATTATAKTLGVMTPEYQKQLALAKGTAKAEDDRAAAVKKAAEEQKKFSDKVKAGISDRMIEEAIAGKPTQLGLERMGVADLLNKALKPGMGGLAAGMAKDLDFSKLVDSFGPVNQQMEHFSFNANAVQDGFNRMAQRMRDAKAPADAIAEALMRDGASAQEAAAAIAQTTKATFDWAGAIQGAVMVAGMFGDKAGQLVGILGNVQQAFANAKTGVDKFNAIASGVGQIGSMIGGKTGGALQGAAGGAMMGLAIGGPVGAVIGGIGGAIMGFISKKKQMAKELTSMREQFVQSAGGMEALKKKAQEAGLSLDALFKARNKDQLSKAIDDIGGKLQTWDEAHEKLQAAVEKYGFTVEELGPKFRQQELDTQAGELLQDYELLKASGIDNNLILSKMAPNMSEYIQTAIRAGSTVPMAMKPAIDAMIQNGQLLDENGQAYASAEAAGITFAQTMSEQFSTLIQKIGDLVAALTGIPNVDRTVTVTTRQEGGGAGAGEGGGDYGGVPEDYRAASGFHAMVRQPTRILVGEAGAERVDVTPQGAEGGAGWGGGAQITFAPVFPGDPLQSNEARRDLSDYQMDQFFRKARNSPLMRATLTQNGRRR